MIKVCDGKIIHLSQNFFLGKNGRTQPNPHKIQPIELKLIKFALLMITFIFYLRLNSIFRENGGPPINKKINQV